MAPARRVAMFALWFAAAFGLLAGLWPWVGGAYGRAFRAVGQQLFFKCGADARVQFVPRKEGVFDSQLQLYNRRRATAGGTAKAATVDLSTRFAGYLPTVFFLALAAATLTADRRRWWTLALGCVAVQGMVAVNLFLLIHRQFALQADGLGLPPYAPWTQTLVTRGWELFEHLGFPLALVVLIWAGTAFRASDWSRLTGNPAPESPAPSVPPPPRKRRGKSAR